jgi:hypothetical protein
MPPAEFEPTIPASERPQTHALGLADTGIGLRMWLLTLIAHRCWVINTTVSYSRDVGFKYSNSYSPPSKMPA